MRDQLINATRKTPMPMIQSDGCQLNVQVEGPERAPVLMLCNSLGTDLHMWDDQVKAITERYRLVRYDRRGHGKSGAPKGPYNMEMLGRDALAVMDGVGVQKVNWCGLSMGGMVGMWLGANVPQRIDRLVLSNTSSYMADKQIWNDRIKTVRAGGLAAIVDGTMERWFTKPFRESSPEAMERIRAMFMATNTEGYIGCGQAIRDMDHRPLLAKINTPTLVVAGRYDLGTPLEAGEFIAQHTPNAQLAVLETAHIANMEQPKVYTDTVLEFLLGK